MGELQGRNLYVCRAQQRCPAVGDRGLDGNACLEHGSAHGGKGGGGVTGSGGTGDKLEMGRPRGFLRLR